MMEHISEMLESFSDGSTAKKASKHTRCLRGIRGVPTSEIARIATAAYEDERPKLPMDEGELNELFNAAYEDGLVAVGLLATTVSDSPEDALELALDWAERTDDVVTADALGWFVIGPAFAYLSPDRKKEAISRLKSHHREVVHRVAVATAYASLPMVLEGPSAAPLRRKHSMKSLRMREEADVPSLEFIGTTFIRDSNAPVQKGLRRMFRAWANSNPASLVAWAGTVSGGLPKLLRNEVKRAARRAEK